MDNIKIKVKKEKLKLENLKKVKDGPGVSDIKESRGRKKSPVFNAQESRIVQIKGKNKNEIKIKRKVDLEKVKLGFKILYLVALVLILIIGAIFGYFAYYKALNKEGILNIVPQKTVLYAEINYNKLKKDYQGGDLGSFVAKILKKDEFNNETTKFINNNILAQYSLDFSENIDSNISNKMALAVFLNKEEKLTTAVFLEIKDKNIINNIFEHNLSFRSQISESLGGIEIDYASFEDNKLNFYYTFVNNFLVLSKDKKSLQEIITISKGKSLSLSNLKQFKEVATRAIRSQNHYFYINFSDLTLNNFNSTNFFNYSFKNLSPLYVFLKKIGSASFYLKPMEKGINIYGFSSWQKEEKNIVKISDFIPSQTISLLSSYNFKNEWLDYSSYLKENNPVMNSILNNFASNLKEKYSLNLEEDIYPLLEKETEIALTVLPDNKDNLVIILPSENKEQKKLKMEKIEGAISSYFGLLYPKEKSFQLADGSEATEYFSNTESFPFEDIKIQDFSGRGLNNDNFNYSYIFTEDKLILSTSRQILEEIITTKNNKKGLTDQPEFNELMKLNNNESEGGLIYLDFEKIFGKIGISETVVFNKLKKFILTSESKSKGTEIIGSLLVE